MKIMPNRVLEKTSLQKDNELNDISKKILITGAGRCGTSVFMRFLHKYLDHSLFISKSTTIENGFSINLAGFWNHKFNAGFEYIINKFSKDIDIELSPKIFKDPRLTNTLYDLISERSLNVQHLFILIRDYEKSALSRQKKDMWFFDEKRLNDKSKTKLQHQIEFNKIQIAEIMLTVAEYDIPHTILSFPKFAEDKNYLYEKLKNTPLNISKQKLDLCFSVFDKSQINF